MSTETQQVELIGEEVVRNLVRAALLAALTGGFAYVTFPNPASPTQVTLQVLGVFMAGLLLGPVWGGISMALYLAAGAVGVPVFANASAGFGPLVGTTAGFLWSYPLAAALIGAIAYGSLETDTDLDAPLWRLVAALVAGTVVIYALGAAGLVVLGNLSVEVAIISGTLTFLPAEAVKAAVAIGIVRADELSAT
ncbi:MAG: biotin transporter BioY [Halobacteriales archaeon]|nr:biotin transporter BioY [Halobacteriales archaeon]